MNLALVVEGISFQHHRAKRACLEDIFITTRIGEIHGLLGPNGAGKTTLFSLLTGQRQIQQGSIRWFDQTFSSGSNVRCSRVAICPQDFAFYPDLTVLENLRFFQQMQPRQGNADLDHIVFQARLGELLQQRAEHLSGGQKRRLNLAIALLSEPDILILDEPTVGIDPQSRKFILERIKELNEQGITIFFTSHQLNEVEELCDHITIIDQGKVIYDQQEWTGFEHPIEISTEPALAANFDLPEYCLLKEGRLLIRHPDHCDINALLQQIMAKGVQITHIGQPKDSLEQLFFQLTHEQLRE